jgi:hypothetical protein
MPKDLNTEALQARIDREAVEAARADVHAAGSPAPEPTQEEVDSEAASEARRERSIEEENERLRARLAELEAREADLDALRRRWADGNYSDLPENFPFEILVHSDISGLDKSAIITPEINGQRFTIARGVATKVPHCVVKLLSTLRYDYWTKEVDERTGQQVLVHNKGMRYNFTAHPVYGEREWNLPFNFTPEQMRKLRETRDAADARRRMELGL